MIYINDSIYQHIKHGGKEKKFYNDLITFDIESTNYSKEISFMWVWAVNVNGVKYKGRTWSEFKDFVDGLNERWKKKTFIIWVHNLSFEFRFMEKIFPFEKVFATSPHKVVYADYENIRFRCSYFMSNLPLAKLQTSYNLPTPKLVGDLDYNLIRHKSTPLTESDESYLENDVQLLYEYIEYMYNSCGGFSTSKMPLTSTGYTRKYLRDKAREQNEYGALRAIVREASPKDSKLYNLLKRCFAGGYTHANWIYCKTIVDNVTSLDKTSFYPAIMCKEKFPREFIKMKNTVFTKYLKNPEEYAMIFDCCFFNLKAKTSQSIISKHKCSYIKNDIYTLNRNKEVNKKSCKPIFDNGRVRKAEILVISLTELDFDTICKFYTFDKYCINNLYISRKRYLPKTLIDTILDLYSDKTTLKDVDGMELEYMNKKGKLNSLYGVCVTDILQAIIDYQDGEWENLPLQGDELQKYIDNNNSILLYQTGVYVTAYARHELLEHNLIVGDDTVYNDTDSIKLINYNKYDEYFKNYDEHVQNQLKEMCRYYKIDVNRLEPCDKYGNKHFLGVMSNEGTYKRFKTLGCKRYIYEDKKGLHCTVAGISKKAMKNYLEEQSQLLHEDVFDIFNIQLNIPESKSGKNTHYYTKEHEPIKIIDYLGNEEIQEIYTGISIIPQNFQMNMSADYSNFLQFSISIVGNNHCEKYDNVRKLTGVKTLWD